jgi:hypothetical protein
MNKELSIMFFEKSAHPNGEHFNSIYIYKREKLKSLGGKPYFK